MPGRDRTGPQGMGSMTGLGAGYCGSRRAAGGNPVGRGWQCGGAQRMRNGYGGLGRRNMFGAAGRSGWRSSGWDSPELKAQSLKEQAAYLEDELERVKQELADAEKEGKA